MNLIFIVGVLLLIFIVMMVFIFLTTKTKKPSQYYIDNIDSLNVSHEEFHKVLNFMLMYGIIDLEEYNKIMLKGLPFAR